MNNNNLISSSQLSRKILVILLALIIMGMSARLYKINNPLMEGHHVFRQHDTAAIARNYFEGEMNIFYPQVDWRGNSPGYVETELQIYPYLVAMLYSIFGPHEWLGRVLNIIFYVISAFLLFRLSRSIFDEHTALIAVFFYSFMPLSFFYSHSFQPDTLLALCSIAGVYYFWMWTQKNSSKSLVLSALGISLAVLIKPPSLYLGVPLLYLGLRKFGWRLLFKPVLWLFAAIVLIPSLLWYSHAFHLWETYGNTMGILGVRSILEIWLPSDLRWLLLVKELLSRLIIEIVTPPGLLLLLIGFFTKPPRGNYVLNWWMVGFVVYILLVPWGNRGHDYYQLPIVFATSAYMGYGAKLLLEKKIFMRSLVNRVFLFVFFILSIYIFLFIWEYKEDTDFKLVMNVLTAVFTIYCASLFLVKKGLSKVVIGTVSIAVLCFSAWQLNSMYFIDELNWDRVNFGKRVNRLTEQNELVVFATPRFPPPQLLQKFYRHRTTQGGGLKSDPVDPYKIQLKGWSIDEVIYFMDALHMDRVNFGKSTSSIIKSADYSVFASPHFSPPQLLQKFYRHRTAQGERLKSDPVDFYQSHRNGWSIDEIQASPEFVEILRQRGAKYFATFYPEILERNSNLKVALDSSHSSVEITSEWAIYRLEDPVRILQEGYKGVKFYTDNKN